jgi:hypothetical protein
MTATFLAYTLNELGIVFFGHASLKSTAYVASRNISRTLAKKSMQQVLFRKNDKKHDLFMSKSKFRT